MLFLFGLILCALTLRPAPAAAQDVVEQIQDVLNLAEGALSEWFARSQPLPAASAGVSYSFDPATGNFRRDPSTFGQIYLDRADPLGPHRWNVSFAYQYTELDQIEGHDADNLQDPLPIPLPGLFGAIEIPHLRINAAVHGFLFALNYGISENIDASIAVPVLYSDLRVRADLFVAGFTDEGTLIQFEDHPDDKTHAVGAGDVLLRGKYRFLQLDALHAAAGLLLRLPSGNQDDLQGTGFVEVAPSLLASTRIFEPAEWARFQGHGNATMGFNAEDVDSSEFRWGVGIDWGITESLTTAVAFLGRETFSRIGPDGAFLFPRCTTDIVTCAANPSARTGVAPLFGITGDRANYYTASIGARGGLWRDTLFAFVNVAIPLNDGFVRTEPIPLAGIEGTF